jgi:type III restriction enzyme
MSLELKNYQERTLETLKVFLLKASAAGPAVAYAKHADENDGKRMEYRPIADEKNVPLATLVNVPYVCLRIPTGGGKTVLGAHIIKVASQSFLGKERPLVLWMVPTKQIKNQTLEAFKNPRHPYRQELDDTFGGKVAVFDISDAGNIRPQDISDSMCLVIGTLATARVTDPEIRDFYAHKEDLEPHFLGLNAQQNQFDALENGSPKFSFANLLRMHHPLVITDEAHNANSNLSSTVYDRLSPAAIIELTATPDMAYSNVLVSVSASELKAEQMIKLPVVLKEHTDGWHEAVRDSLQRRAHLEKLAKDEPDYLRPILLLQAENDNQTATVSVIKQHLIDNELIPANQIAIATGDQRELDGVNLFEPGCPVRIVITKDALKEGWDCSFAYVLCSVTNQRSKTDIQQLLGRVLRMPYARTRQNDELNKAYAHVVSASFGLAAQELTNDLEAMGFNLIEAATGIVSAPELDLTGGELPLFPSSLSLQLEKAPDLAGIPDADLAHIKVVPNPDNSGKVTVEITGRLDEATQDAVVATLPVALRKEAKKRLAHHNIRMAANETPAQRNADFSVPKLMLKQGGLVLEVSSDLLNDLTGWSLGVYPADLSAIRFNESAQSFEVDIDGDKVVWRGVQEPARDYLAGFAADWTELELIAFLDRQLRQPDVTQPVMVTWLQAALTSLTQRGFSLAQCVRGKFIIARVLAEQIQNARKLASSANYQVTLFDNEPAVVVNPEFSYRFDSTSYPAHSYCTANYQWKKHFYAFPGDLPHKRKDGSLAEEFQCAVQLDLLDQVEFWVRNLVHPSQFWLPTATGRTYPDFIAKLKDGRLFVIEYKGGDRVSNADSQAKEKIGQLWERASGAKGIYRMVVLNNNGADIRSQLLSAIG